MPGAGRAGWSRCRGPPPAGGHIPGWAAEDGRSAAGPAGHRGRRVAWRPFWHPPPGRRTTVTTGRGPPGRRRRRRRV
ncbi:hypothetical protein ACFFX0_15470 [Citricoccus parietis]|uniref:Uncharacterized protein n=1 Tax=Citricoccus parietis TaxID=592307 RepID=A0ABV5G0Q8_9MICC